MLKLKYKTCGRVKTIVSSRKHSGVAYRYSKIVNRDHVCCYEEIKNKSY